MSWDDDQAYQTQMQVSHTRSVTRQLSQTREGHEYIHHCSKPQLCVAGFSTHPYPGALLPVLNLEISLAAVGTFPEKWTALAVYLIQRLLRVQTPNWRPVNVNEEAEWEELVALSVTWIHSGMLSFAAENNISLVPNTCPWAYRYWLRVITAPTFHLST